MPGACSTTRYVLPISVRFAGAGVIDETNGGCEMRKALVVVAGLSVIAGGLAASSTSSQAAAPKMTVTGSVVGGVKAVQNGQDLVFTFTDTNSGTTTNTDNIFYLHVLEQHRRQHCLSVGQWDGHQS